MDTVTVNLRFIIDTVLGPYSDTLSFTEEGWLKRDQKQIDISKQSLADTWVTFRSEQIAEEEKLSTIQGKQDKVYELETKIADLTIMKAKLEAEIIDIGK